MFLNPRRLVKGLRIGFWSLTSDFWSLTSDFWSLISGFVPFVFFVVEIRSGAVEDPWGLHFVVDLWRGVDYHVGFGCVRSEK